MRVPSLTMSAARKLTPSRTFTCALVSSASASAAPSDKTHAHNAISRVRHIGIPCVCGRMLLLLNLIIAREAETADAASVLLGEETFPVARTPERISAADI